MESWAVAEISGENAASLFAGSMRVILREICDAKTPQNH
jgi:hypothetical protein